jgi:tellurite resistance protein
MGAGVRRSPTMSDVHVPFDAAQKEVRAKLRERLQESAEDLKASTTAAEGGTRLSLAARIEALGFAGQAAKVFDLLPLVHVAWADGGIQAGERATVLRLLELRGLPPGEAWTVMEALLEERPSQAYLDVSLDVLRDLLEAKGDDGRTIVGLCVVLAESAGGFLGLGAISKAERQMIETIAARLGDKAQAEFRSRLG